MSESSAAGDLVSGIGVLAVYATEIAFAGDSLASLQLANASVVHGAQGADSASVSAGFLVSALESAGAQDLVSGAYRTLVLVNEQAPAGDTQYALLIVPAAGLELAGAIDLARAVKVATAEIGEASGMHDGLIAFSDQRASVNEWLESSDWFDADIFMLAETWEALAARDRTFLIDPRLTANVARVVAASRREDAGDARLASTVAVLGRRERIIAAGRTFKA